MAALLTKRAEATLTRLVTEEHGASYTLGFTLLMPLIVFLLACFAEVSMCICVKVGVTHAANNAAQAAVVWLDETSIPMEYRLGAIHAAAVHSLAPFGSGNPRHVVPTGTLRYPANAAGDWIAVHKNYFSGMDEEFARRKWTYAAHATDVSVVSSQTPQGFPMVTVCVTYVKPFHLNAVGKFFGRRPPWPGADFFVRPITSQATIVLPPRVAEQATPGIPFAKQLEFTSTANIIFAGEQAVGA